MSTSIERAFAIPHIAKAITDALSFKDLLHCIVVNRIWHDAMIGILWLDVVTFRFKGTHDEQEAFVRHAHHIRALTCSMDLDFLRILAEEPLSSSSSSSISSSPSSSSSSISSTPCTNLIEINCRIHYRSESDQQLLDQGYQLLEKIIRRNPNLKAVSIENVNFVAAAAAEEGGQEEGVQAGRVGVRGGLMKFINFLDEFPNIQCVYLGSCAMSTTKAEQMAHQILMKRVARVINVESVTSIRFLSNVPRSNRGLPVYSCDMDTTSSKTEFLYGGARTLQERQQLWPGRESILLELMEGYEQPRLHKGESRGRWDFESRSPTYHCEIGVFENGSVLEIATPASMEHMLDYKQILCGGRFPNLQHLAIAYDSEQRSTALLAKVSDMDDSFKRSLRQLEIKRVSQAELTRFLDDPEITQLTEIAVSSTQYYMWNSSAAAGTAEGAGATATDIDGVIFSTYPMKYIKNPLHYMSSALTGFSFDQDLPFTHCLQLLNACHHLRSLKLSNLLIDGTEKSPLTLSSSLPWATTSLQTVHLTIKLEGHLNESQRHLPDDLDEEIPRRSTRSAELLAPLFMKQLGEQVWLRYLSLSFNRTMNCATSPFLCLDADSKKKNGLQQLKDLRRLEQLTISGLVHRVGAKEVEWMGQHWPRLRWIELPVFYVHDSSDGNGDSDGGEGRGEREEVGELGYPDDCILPDYKAVFPDLKVQIPWELYVCGICELFPCETQY